MYYWFFVESLPVLKPRMASAPLSSLTSTSHFSLLDPSIGACLLPRRRRGFSYLLHFLQGHLLNTSLVTFVAVLVLGFTLFLCNKTFLMSGLVSVIVETSNRSHTFPSIALQQCLIVKLVKCRAMCLHSDIRMYTLLILRGRGTLLGIISFAIFIDTTSCWSMFFLTPSQLLTAGITRVHCESHDPCMLMCTQHRQMKPQRDNEGSDAKTCSSAQ